MRRPMTPQKGEVAHYYHEMTESYSRYGGETLALHTGLFDSKTASKTEALLLSNDLLVEGIALGPGRRILDAGCGMGGLAIYLAQKFQVESVGVTICPSHVEIARRNAQKRGVSHLTQFYHMDYMELDFPADSFDAVLSQDAFCYATSLEDYALEMNRVLKPGGSWRAIDAFSVTSTPEEALSPTDIAICRGWKTPVFPSWAELRDVLIRTGFGQLLREDLSTFAEPAAQDFIREKLLSELTSEFVQQFDDRQGEIYRDHMAACASFGVGVLDGSIQYLLVGGVKI